MRPNFSWLFPSLFLLALTACSDGSDRRAVETPIPVPPIPEPEVTDLDATGIYSGTLITPEGDVALMTVVLARTGETSITLETDDSERANIVLWGLSSGSDGESEIPFDGVDTNSGDSISVTLLADNGAITGDLALGSTIAGSFDLPMTHYSADDSSLALVAGSYSRVDNIDGQTVLEVSDDGSAQLSGSCSASGTVSVIDSDVNIYALVLESDCISVDALLSLQSSEVSADTMVISGTTEAGGLSFALYRI